MLVLERVRQLMGHHHALIVEGAPVRNVELLSFGIVEPLNLLGEHIDHKSIEIESFGKQAEGFRAALVRIALGGIFLFVHLLDDVSADFLARAQRFFQRRHQFQPGDLAHLPEHFIGSCNEIGIRGSLGISGRRRHSRCLRAPRDATKQQGKAQENGAQPKIVLS
jgi:hypothetical protein